MVDSNLRPDTINKLRFSAEAAFAMLAGMQLDVFTSMKDGPVTAEQIANAVGAKSDRLRFLLWSLVAAGLATELNLHLGLLWHAGLHGSTHHKDRLSFWRRYQ